MKFILVFIFIFMSSSLCAKDYGEDYTENYQRIMATFSRSITSDKDLVQKLENFHIVIVPGVVSESLMENSNQALKLGFLTGEIFADHEKWLKRSKLNYTKLVLESEASSAENAEVILDELNKIDKKIILFAHSKGGLDALEAYAKDKDSFKNVVSFISVQSPFYGAPVSDTFNNYYLTRNISAMLFEFLGGSLEGLSNLTVKYREPYMKDIERKGVLAAINKQMKVLNYSSKKENIAGWDTPLELFRDLTDQISGENDGVVPVDSAILPRTNYIIENGVDHLLSVTDCKGIYKPSNFSWGVPTETEVMWSYDRLSHFKTLLKIGSDGL